MDFTEKNSGVHLNLEPIPLLLWVVYAESVAYLKEFHFSFHFRWNFKNKSLKLKVLSLKLISKTAVGELSLVPAFSADKFDKIFHKSDVWICI